MLVQSSVHSLIIQEFTKGYQYCCLSTYHFYMSADVTFFENEPFFASPTACESISQVLPIPLPVLVVLSLHVID